MTRGEDKNQKTDKESMFFKLKKYNFLLIPLVVRILGVKDETSL